MVPYGNVRQFLMAGATGVRLETAGKRQAAPSTNRTAAKGRRAALGGLILRFGVRRLKSPGRGFHAVSHALSGAGAQCRND